MRTAQIQTKMGNREHWNCYDVNDFPYELIHKRVLNCRTTKNPAQYLTNICTFDIETTTIDSETPYGYMYHWQMCIDGIVCTGRRWEEWVEFMESVVDRTGANMNKRLVIYVHNLGYEFQFIRDYLNAYFGGFRVFAVAPRKPIKITTGNGLEFRCSYRLTNMSLYKACENELGVKHPKAKGDLDFKIKRTAYTFLNDEEFGYCVSDVISLWELITRKMVNEHDNLESIPLTSTGYVRRDCRNATRKDKNYRKYFEKNHLSTDVYTLLKEAGRGGNTHANRYLSGNLWHEVDSYDVASSYPYVMITKKFPSTKFWCYGKVKDLEEYRKIAEKYACLFRLVLSNVSCKNSVTMPYISASKCLAHGNDWTLDNGRVLSSDLIALTVTDIDFAIISEQYEYEDIGFSALYCSKYDYIPDSLRGKILEYFRDKCELKYKVKNSNGDEKANYEYLYGKQKNRLNGIFGMCYTDPVRDDLRIDDEGHWVADRGDINEKLEKYNSSRNSFVVYAVGVWVTAHARAHLQRLLDAAGDGAIYCDTDSCKGFGIDKQIIERINAEIQEECERCNAYSDVNGKRYYLGVYEYEGRYSDFRTLGAKKYCYVEDGELHVTISGVNKALAPSELGDINNFKPGFIFRKAGGSTLYYNDSEIHNITIDGCTMSTASNIGMVDSTYEIGITDEYASLIGFNLLKLIDGSN